MSESPIQPDTRSPATGLHLLGVEQTALAEWFGTHGQPAYRAAQVLQWVYERGVRSFDEMTNLPRELRAWLGQSATVYSGAVDAQSVASDETHKLLIRWPDEASIETVWIPSDDRNTACISSQVGCPVGCRFCASGLDGVQRNLTAGEIVEQALHVEQLIRQRRPDGPRRAASARTRLSNIVLMGMGEPLANYKNVVAALRILNAPWGLGIGARKITLSTVGLPKQIRMLAEEKLQINLALSLHAVDDALRTDLIPWGRGVPIADLLAACDYFFRTTGREVTLEYVLLAGVNDRPSDASALATIARRLRANVNLLRYNPVPGLPFERPSSEAAFAFQRVLRDRGVNVHIRTSRGTDAQAACGQLRRTVKLTRPSAAGASA